VFINVSDVANSDAVENASRKYCNPTLYLPELNTCRMPIASTVAFLQLAATLSAVSATAIVSVRLSVRHMPVLCQNE